MTRSYSLETSINWDNMTIINITIRQQGIEFGNKDSCCHISVITIIYFHFDKMGQNFRYYTFESFYNFLMAFTPTNIPKIDYLLIVNALSYQDQLFKKLQKLSRCTNSNRKLAVGSFSITQLNRPPINLTYSRLQGSFIYCVIIYNF